MKKKILFDVYNISKRIRNIERNYYVVFNTSNNKFEVHNSSQIGSSYCLTLPYDKLDERTLKYVRSSNCTNIDEILEKLENDNKIRESANNSSAFSHIVDLGLDMEKENENY